MNKLKRQRYFIRQMFKRLETATNWQLFGFSVLWVLVGGLLLQLVFLPYILPSAHWGHGLIVGLDSIQFHGHAIRQVGQIRQLGWGALAGEPDFQVVLASVLYTVTYPEPWVVLPVNAILFGIAIVAIRRLLTALVDSSAVALLALAPFFVFPSFVPIWGQLHRDLIVGTGLCVVLCALVLAAKRGSGSTSLRGCVAMAGLGMGLMWVSRSYALALVAGATVAFVTFALLGRACSRGRLSVVAALVLLTAGTSIGDWTRPRGDVASMTAGLPPASARPIERPSVEPSWPSWSWSSVRLPRTRRGDPSSFNCLPKATSDIADRLLFNLCYAREGFVVDAIRSKAGSAYDLDVRLRSAEDFIAYGPRAVAATVLEPVPGRWWAEKQSTVGRLGALFVPIEMSAAYATWLLAIIFGGRWRTRPAIVGVFAFSMTYTLFYVFAVPQLGTLYRMRAFAFAIIVCTALAIVLANKAGMART